MSIKIMTTVWQQSLQKGTALLLLLAIADNANDSGVAWPGIEYLAHKIRMSARQTQRLVKELVESGELLIEQGTGRSNSHRYYVLVGKSTDEITELEQKIKKDDKMSPFLKSEKTGKPKPKKGDKMTPFTEIPPAQKGDNSTRKGDIFDEKGDTAMSPEPYNRQENHQGMMMVMGSPPEQNQQIVDFVATITEIFTQATGDAPTQKSLTRLTWLAGECEPSASKFGKSGRDWVLDALRESVGRADDLVAYTIGIIRRWQQDGPRSDTRPQRPGYRPARSQGAPTHERKNTKKQPKPTYTSDF